MKSHYLPIFYKQEWLDTISINGFGRSIDNKGKSNYSFFFKKKYGFKIITMPPLTPYMGPVLHYPEGQKQSTKYAFEKEQISKALGLLPQTDKCIQYLHPSLTNALPFQWDGYNISNRYTFILEGISDHEKIYKNFRENVRREIKKAEKKLTIKPVNKCKRLFELKQLDYKNKKIRLDHSFNYLKGIFDLCKRENWGEILEASDQEGNLHASVLIVWDEQCAYYLLGAVNREFKNSGAISLLLWESIKRSSKRCNKFDFEGSMNPAIEKFFRGFGGILTPYLAIKKFDSKLLKTIE